MVVGFQVRFDARIGMNQTLFDKGDAVLPPRARLPPQAMGGNPRLRVPQRNQVEMHWASLDELLEPDHPARMVWAFVCGLDLGRWLTTIKAVEGVAGRDATDPRLLVALWIYATIEGVGSARELERLCEKHLAYQWLCGGVSVNYHLLSDFRSQGGDKWDDLLTQIVASLLAEKLGHAEARGAGRDARAGQRGRGVVSSPAASGAVSGGGPRAGRGPETTWPTSRPRMRSRRRQAARQRASEERQRRLEEAIRNCDQLQQQREETAKITGKKPVEVAGLDHRSRGPHDEVSGRRISARLQRSVQHRHGQRHHRGRGRDEPRHGHGRVAADVGPIGGALRSPPEEALVDGGFASLDAIDDAAEHGCTVYAPLKDEQKQLAAGKDPYAPKRYDSAAVASWRERMGTAAAKLVYRLRCQTAEWVNAICRNRDLRQMPVRGRPKCRTIAVLYAITHDMVRAAALRAKAAEMSG